MTLIMTNVRPETRRGTPGEARKEMRRETLTTETMTGAHGTMTTLRSHVSAVTSLQIENHMEDNIHVLETLPPTPDMDLLGTSQLVIVIVTVIPLIDPAAPRLMQAMMREIDVETMTDAVMKTVDVMKTDDVTKIEAMTKIEAVTKTEVATKTDAVAGTVHLLMAAT